MMFRDMHEYCKCYESYQKLGVFTKKNDNSLTHIHTIEDSIMGELTSYGHSLFLTYILIAVDYVFKCVEVAACRSNDKQMVIKFLKEHILSRVGFLNL